MDQPPPCAQSRRSLAAPRPQQVHGFVLKGRWRYLEHDWIATAGSDVFEPPGETNTAVVPEDVEDMMTFFRLGAAMYYVAPYENHMGFENDFIKIAMCRAHFESVGLGADDVNQFIR